MVAHTSDVFAFCQEDSRWKLMRDYIIPSATLCCSEVADGCRWQDGQVEYSHVSLRDEIEMSLGAGRAWHDEFPEPSPDVRTVGNGFHCARLYIIDTSPRFPSNPRPLFELPAR